MLNINMHVAAIEPNHKWHYHYDYDYYKALLVILKTSWPKYLDLNQFKAAQTELKALFFLFLSILISLNMTNYIIESAYLLRIAFHCPNLPSGLPSYGTVDRSEKYHRPDAHQAATLDRPGQRAGSVPFADTENDRDLATTDNPAYQPAEVLTAITLFCYCVYIVIVVL